MEEKFFYLIEINLQNYGLNKN